MTHKIKTLLIFLCLLASSCQKEEKKQVSYPVLVSEVFEEDVPYFVKGVGQFVASLQVEIKAQVSGYLTSVLFMDGQMVQEDDLLMTIDPRIYEATVNETKAQVEEDRAKLTYALDLAETYGKLVGNDYVSRLQYDQAVQDVDAFKAAVELDLAAVKKAEVNLGFTQLKAPTKGYIGLRKFDPGNYVDASADTTLVTINKVTPLSIKFFLPSEYLQEIREAQKKDALYLEAVIPNDVAHPLKGSLFFIDNNVNKETGMFILEGTIPNEDERGWPGQFARVYLRIKTIKNAVLVPKQAVVIGENGNLVFILDENSMTVSLRMIGKGIVYKDSIVALWGLKPGEKVVIDGQLNLYNGAKVHLPKEL